MNGRVFTALAAEGRPPPSSSFTSFFRPNTSLFLTREKSQWVFWCSWRLNGKRESCSRVYSSEVCLRSFDIKYGLHGVASDVGWGISRPLSRINSTRIWCVTQKTRSLDSCWVARCQEMNLEEFLEINLHARPRFEKYTVQVIAHDAERVENVNLRVTAFSTADLDWKCFSLKWF
jgi:hypothetical protein